MASAPITSKKRKRGIYYTPAKATKLLCDWAIRSPKDTILEPSFGGCGFLQSSKERLHELGCNKPNELIFGCDIDRNAFKHLYDKVGAIDLNERFLLADYLTLSPKSFKHNEFDVIIGNPPYVAHHDMYKKQKLAARNALNSSNYSVRGRTSLWAYFVLHSIAFLKQGGRMAWLLPGSLINTYYGKDVLKVLERNFSSLIILPCEKRIFIDEGAKENTVVLLADNKSDNNSDANTQVEFINSLDQFAQVTNMSSRPSKTTGSTLPGKYTRSRLSNSGQIAFENMCNNSFTTSVGEILDIRIGIVTGNNQFFILSKEKTKHHKIPNGSLRPIFSRQIICAGVQLNSDDLSNAIESNFRCLLLDTVTNGLRSKHVRTYLETYPKDDLALVKTFKKRSIWHQPDDGKDPDGFFLYMGHIGPRLILNCAKTTSTNTIHRAYFKVTTPKYKKKLISISLLTSFSQLSAELEGRSYGSGVLKHEPTEAKAIRLYLPTIYTPQLVNRNFKLIDTLLRSGDSKSATKLADDFIFKDYFAAHPRQRHIIESALDSVRKYRMGKSV